MDSGFHIKELRLASSWYLMLNDGKIKPDGFPTHLSHVEPCQDREEMGVLPCRGASTGHGPHLLRRCSLTCGNGCTMKHECICLEDITFDSATREGKMLVSVFSSHC